MDFDVESAGFVRVEVDAVSAITVLHPGAMGVSVAPSFAAVGHDVRWVTAGRSDATGRGRCGGSGRGGDLLEGCAHADVVMSVCPPASALAVASAVAAEGFGGVYVDANAISPATMAEVASTVRAGGAVPVDGSIIGLPARRAGTTRLYLAGEGAAALAADLEGGPLGVRAVDGAVGAASALKMAYAGWTKGSSALLLAVVAYASEAGCTAAAGRVATVDAADAGPGGARAAGVGPKAWRFAGRWRRSPRRWLPPGYPTVSTLRRLRSTSALAGFRDADHRRWQRWSRRFWGGEGSQAANPATTWLGCRPRWWCSVLEQGGGRLGPAVVDVGGEQGVGDQVALGRLPPMRGSSTIAGSRMSITVDHRSPAKAA